MVAAYEIDHKNLGSMDTLARNTSLSVFVAIKPLADAQKMCFNLKKEISEFVFLLINSMRKCCGG